MTSNKNVLWSILNPDRKSSYTQTGRLLTVSLCIWWLWPVCLAPSLCLQSAVRGSRNPPFGFSSATDHRQDLQHRVLIQSFRPLQISSTPPPHSETVQKGLSQSQAFYFVLNFDDITAGGGRVAADWSVCWTVSSSWHRLTQTQFYIYSQIKSEAAAWFCDSDLHLFLTLQVEIIFIKSLCSD